VQSGLTLLLLKFALTRAAGSAGLNASQRTHAHPAHAAARQEPINRGTEVRGQAVKPVRRGMTGPFVAGMAR
jgi:hypothetical protein